MSGSGKTLLLAVIAWKKFLEGYRIYSNMDLDFVGSCLSFMERYFQDKLNYVPLFSPRDLYNIPRGEKFFVCIDEMDIWGSSVEDGFSSGVDSYNYKSENAQLTAIFFKKYLRKMGGEVIFSVQQFRLCPIRVREEVEYQYFPRITKHYKTEDPAHPIAPLQMVVYEKKISPVNSEFYDTGMMWFLKHPVLKIPVITPGMLKIYDTNASILTEHDMHRSKGTSFSENAVNDEDLFQLANKMFGNGAIVEKLDDSGRYSKWLGDVLVINGSAQVVLDMVGVKRRGTSAATKGKALYIDLKPKWKRIADMLAIDKKVGSSHLLVYYDEDPTVPENRVWKFIPIDMLESSCNLRNPAQLSKSKIVTTEKLLRVQKCGPQPFENIEDLFLKA